MIMIMMIIVLIKIDWKEGERDIISVLIFTIVIINNRYEIDWIGREGLACETHDEFLRVSQLTRPDGLNQLRIGWSSIHMSDHFNSSG